MRNIAKNKMIPVLTSLAGSCLTEKNWQEVGVEIISCSFAELLMKPGIDYLNTLPRLADYVVWERQLVLNASSLVLSTENRYQVRSHYDGKTIIHSLQHVADTLLHLKPNFVLLPKGFYQIGEIFLNQLSQQSFVFIPADEAQYYAHEWLQGIYYTDASVERFRDEWKGLKHYWLSEDLACQDTRGLVFDFIETDGPARLACEGKIFAERQILDITLSDYATQFKVLEEGCLCPTCQSQFTRAYLHHLLENTPLLCQRYLIQHNVFSCTQAG